MAKPTRAEIIDFAIELLDAGVLASELPAELMAEFNLTPAKSADNARPAWKRWRR